MKQRLITVTVTNAIDIRFKLLHTPCSLEEWVLEQLFGAGPRIHLRLTAAPKAHVSVERTAKKIQKSLRPLLGMLGLGRGTGLDQQQRLQRLSRPQPYLPCPG